MICPAAQPAIRPAMIQAINPISSLLGELDRRTRSGLAEAITGIGTALRRLCLYHRAVKTAVFSALAKINVRPQDSCRIRSGRSKASLPLEVAGSLLHAQIY